jgi:hypothetical protein
MKLPPTLTPWLGWALALLALGAGYQGYGWRGLVLALTVIAFWLILQFSRALRVLRNAGQAPVGRVASAVMLNSKLHTGMRLMDVLRLTGSLGKKLSDPPEEQFEWADAGGDAVRVSLRDGRVNAWRLQRGAEAEPS